MRAVLLIAGWLLVGIPLLVTGCSKSAEKKSAVLEDTTATQSSVPQVRRREPVFDDRYLQRQANRSREVRGELTSLYKSQSRDTAEIRKVILKRKGELLFAQRDIRSHPTLSQQEKDSIIAPLDSEAIELAEELVDLER